MSEGTPKAIEPKGIVRNATKIGVQDGQAEDLINLRFMDGSWRASGNGRQIENMPTGTIYQQLYVHTNIYHHLLGVAPDPNNGDVPTLWWFAEIDNDGVTFYPLDGTSDRSLWPEDKQDLPTERKALTTVVGDVWITQTGHLLTVIDESDDFEHFVFKTGTKEYIEVNMDVNGKPTDRSLHPFGKVHFNLCEPTIDDEDHRHIVRLEVEEFNNLTLHQAHDQMISMYAEATKKNQFTKPFLVLAACRLYDGSHAFASQPVLVWPRDITGIGKHAKSIICRIEEGEYVIDSISMVDNNKIPLGYIYNEDNVFIFPRLTTDNNQGTGIGQSQENPFTSETAGDASSFVCHAVAVNYNNEDAYNVVLPIPKESLPTYSSGILANTTTRQGASRNWGKWTTCVLGSDLVFSLEHTDCIDGDVIVGVDIFITNPADTYYLSEDSYKESPIYDKDKTDEENKFVNSSYSEVSYLDRVKQVYFYSPTNGNYRGIYRAFSYIPKEKAEIEIIHQLLNSPFYLLRSYNKNEFSLLKDNPIVDLTTPECKGILENLVQQKTLDTEALSRTTYLPKVSYMYNGRLHIANYKSHPFFGYPIDLFHLHNHSVKVQDGAWFKGVLPNLADNNDAYLQYTKTPIDVQDAETLGDSSALIDAAAPYFLVKVFIDTAQGEQIVTRYIPAYDPRTPVNGRADFIESLNPLITYPDARSKKIRIYYIHYYHDVDVSIEAFSKMILEKKGYHLRYEEFELKPHPYLNIAYYIDPELKPIRLEAFKLYPARRQPTPEEEAEEYVWVYPGLTLEEVQALANMQNTEEYFPNGLKVSKTDQPMFFPVENTYQVGSAQILALMSNTIAVGTGQTGDAPLYVFCKDGVYALYVDSSGQMAYPNARILARDVCNNPRSVTPIDAGVVFTTDRGLMMIAGEQVQEIGAPAEGDVVQFWNAGSVDYSKIATASMQQIAGLPSSLCSTTDFLTYLQDKGTSGKAAIINYNHNMRELMVSNPNYPYSYVLDREGNWSRRDYTAAQYVNNYPTSYRVDADGHFFKVDDEGNANTTLEHRKEADNKIFYLSNVIKLDSIGFKQAYRFVVRGYFEGVPCAKGTINGVDVYIYDKGAQLIKNTNFGDIIRLQYKLSWGVIRWVNADSGFPAIIRIINQFTGEDITDTIVSADAEVIYNVTRSTTPIACVVEGSYDGRKFKPLGYNRKSGKFRDMGCIVERTDVRFFRICLSGQVTGKTRIDYMEMSAGASMLNTKIR